MVSTVARSPSPNVVVEFVSFERYYPLRGIRLAPVKAKEVLILYDFPSAGQNTAYDLFTNLTSKQTISCVLAKPIDWYGTIKTRVIMIHQKVEHPRIYSDYVDWVNKFIISSKAEYPEYREAPINHPIDGLECRRIIFTYHVQNTCYKIQNYLTSWINCSPDLDWAQYMRPIGPALGMALPITQ